MAESKDQKSQSNRQSPPPPPPMNTGTLGAKADGTPDPEVDGHMDRKQELPEQEQSALGKLGVSVKNMVTGEPDPADTGEIAAPLPPSAGILVIATRDGFYRQQRMKEGDRFNIASEDDWGDWMKLADEKEEEKRAKKARDAKAKADDEAAKEFKADRKTQREMAGF